MITLGLAEAHWRRETLAESGPTPLSALLHHAPAFLAPGIYTDATSHEAAIWGHSGIPIREAASSELCVDHSAMRCVRRCPEAPLRGELCGYRVGRGRGEGKSGPRAGWTVFPGVSLGWAGLTRSIEPNPLRHRATPSLLCNRPRSPVRHLATGGAQSIDRSGCSHSVLVRTSLWAPKSDLADASAGRATGTGAP